MARKTHKISAQQAEYKHQLSLAKRRIKYWEKKYHYYVSNDLSKRKSETYTQAAKRLQNIRYSSLSEKQKQKYEREYIDAYDKGLIRTHVDDKPEYTPPTETDFLSDDRDSYWDWYPEQDLSDDTSDVAADAMSEFNAWIEDIIDSIFDLNGSAPHNPRAETELRNILDDFRNSMGDEAFYNYMSTGSRVSRLHEYAVEAMLASDTPNSNRGNQVDEAILQFAMELNGGSALTDEQAFELRAYGSFTTAVDESDWLNED